MYSQPKELQMPRTIPNYQIVQQQQLHHHQQQNLFHQQLQVFQRQAFTHQQHHHHQQQQPQLPQQLHHRPDILDEEDGEQLQQDGKPRSRRRSWRSKSKRVRTIFTPEQLKRLEQEFSNQMYLVGHDRGFLASSLNLTEAQVKVWFQNRRIKFRKLNPGPMTMAEENTVESANEELDDADSANHAKPNVTS